MPLRLTLPERLLASLNILPIPLFDAPLAPGITKALHTACELGIFDALSGQPLALDALAQRLDCQPQGLSLLLNLLISAGYVRERRLPMKKLFAPPGTWPRPERRQSCNGS